MEFVEGKRMKLSIVVPVYNMVSGNKLEYCLNSLMNQTITDYEVIAVDDASTDNSLDVLRQYEKKYSNILKVLALSENHKQGGAKNAALEICKGEYIGFVDSDDWVMPNMYERLVVAAESNQADIAVCNLTQVYEHTMEVADNIPSMDSDINGELTEEKVKRLIFHSGALVCQVYKRKIFMEPKLRFPEHMFYEDNAIGTEILMRAKKIAYINEPMYFYLQNPQSTVHTISEEKCNHRLEAMRIMIKMAKEGGYLDKYYSEFEYKFINLFYQNTLFSYMQGKQRKKLSFIKNMGREMKEYFPGFENNKYYLEKVNEEERFLMSLQQKSTVLFVCYYKMLWFYRRLRYGKKM